MTPIEEFDTKSSIVGHLLAAGVGVLSIVIALTVPTRLVGFAGFVYFLFGPVMAIHGATAGRLRRRLEGPAQQ